uniref:Uncharacterized protein n=1 Tax=Anopheles culicifacies TaxID=139723 RepID=A0A182MSA9_9DIPT
MYKLAEQFCMECPYLMADRHSVPDGNLPINLLQKPLQVVMKEYIIMQSQLMQLLNLCSATFSFPTSCVFLEMVDHLIKTLRHKNAEQVLQVFGYTAASSTPGPAPNLDQTPSCPLPAECLSAVSHDAALGEQPTCGEANAPDRSEIVSPVYDMRVNQTSTPSIIPTSSRQFNQSTKPAQSVARNTANPPSTSVLQLATIRNSENIPPYVALNLAPGVTRSSTTPLDHPILPGGTSTRSTSSRNQSHIRTLDFDTPPLKRGNSSTPVIPSPTTSSLQSSSPYTSVPLLDRNQSRIPIANKKAKRPNARCCTMCKQMPRCTIAAKKQMKRNVSKRRVQSLNDFNNTNKTIVKTKVNTGATESAPPINLSPLKTLLNAFRPPSTSPPRTSGPDSPAFTADPLAMCPMTPRFLTRPLQPLFMLSPLLGTLDASALSHVKSNSHTKPTDINTPRYPITPGNAITPSPPPDSVSYYESEPGTANIDRPVPADEPDDNSEPRGGSPVPPKPQLTLTASEGSTEIAIQYVEREQLPTVAEDDPEFRARLAARIEIDNGNRVFQIAVSPIIALYTLRRGTKLDWTAYSFPPPSRSIPGTNYSVMGKSVKAPVIIIVHVLLVGPIRTSAPRSVANQQPEQCSNGDASLRQEAVHR